MDSAKFSGSFILPIVFALPLCGQQAASTDVGANPGRPTVSTPATLTPVGYLQFETGLLVATHSPEFSSQLSLNEVAKLTVARRIELLLVSEPAAHSRVGGKAGNSAGGEAAGVQAVLLTGQGPKPTLAAGYVRQIYGGSAPDLDLGSALQSFVVLASADVKGFHYDTNYLANEVAQGRVRRSQFGQTLSVSHPVGQQFNISGELWHFTQPFTHGHCAGALWALGYAPRSNLVFDVGFNRGLTSTSTRWEAFFGFTYLLPHRLWGQK